MSAKPIYAALAGLLSAILIEIAKHTISPWLAFIALVPLFYFQLHTTKKLANISIATFGAALWPMFLSWLPEAANKFTGTTLYGYAVIALAMVLYPLLYIGIFALAKKLGQYQSALQQSLVLATLLTFTEWGLNQALAVYPWFSFHFGNPLLGSNYTIQLAEFGGIYILTFCTVLINAFIANSIRHQFYTRYAVAVIIIFLSANAHVYWYRTQTQNTQNPLKAMLVTGNADPTLNWQTDGNNYIGSLLALNRSAVAAAPNFIIWTESAVPWTYLPNDDFIDALNQQQQHHKVSTLLGINTNDGNHTVLNSIYLLEANAKSHPRYDKAYPLGVIEKAGINSIPIVTNQGFSVNAGQKANVLNTQYGKVGIYICNEATIAQSAQAAVKNGADFLVNSSNDGWFADSYLAKYHFYYNRLRAVENRRDVAINSNRGYCGKVSANGDVATIIPQTNSPSLTQITLNKQNAQTLYTAYPLAIHILLALILAVLMLRR